MVDISTETFAKNCIHTREKQKKGKEPVLWIAIKDLGEKLYIKNIFNLVDKEVKGKFETNYPTKQQLKKYIRHRSEFINDTKFMYAHECIIIPVIMTSRSSKAIKFGSKLGFSQYEITLKKELSVLKSVMNTFEGETMKNQYSVLGYKIDLYFYDYKLAIEVDERGHKDGYVDHEIKRQKAIERELSCKFIRINPDEEKFNIFKTQNEIFTHVKESNKKLTKELTKKSLIDEISNELLGLEFKSNNSIKPNCLKYIVK